MDSEMCNTLSAMEQRSPSNGESPPQSTQLMLNAAINIRNLLQGTLYEITLIERRLNHRHNDLTLRCKLKTPLRNGTGSGDAATSVIVKHVLPFNDGFARSVLRNQVEYLMLSTLPLKVTCGNVTVTTPKAYTYLDDSNTSVFEDIPSTWKLKDALRTGECFPPNVAASVGRALARFTIALYNWSRQPEQAELRERLEGCQWSTNLCYLLTYGQLTAALEKHPDLIGDKAEYIEQARELGRQAIFEKHMHWGIIHADYWTGNVLLPKDLSNCSEEPITLHLLGWEMSKYTSPFFDIGQMMAYLYLPFHFHGIVAGQAAVEAVCQEVSKSPLMEIPRFPFLVAMHFGVHLIVCPYRPPQPEAKEKLNSCIGYGGEVIKAAMTEDVNWLRRSVLGQLFVNV